MPVQHRRERPGAGSPGGPDEMLQDIQTYEDIGVGCIIFDIRGNDLNRSLERLEWFAEEIMFPLVSLR